MTIDLTIIYSFRNRPVERIRNSIQSLIDHGVDAQFMVVDFGSREEFRQDLRDLAQRLPVQLVLMEAQGLPWNKSRALNHGVRQAKTKYIVTSDIDMVYDCNPFDYIEPIISPRTVFIMQAWFLDPSGDRSRAVFGSQGHPGGFVFQERAAFDELGGYDEEIQYWGSEDWDWHDRLVQLGYDVQWLPETFKFYHVWHESKTVGPNRPETASFDTIRRIASNFFLSALSNFWGEPLKRENRPALAAIERGAQAFTVTYHPNTLSGQVGALLKDLAKHGLVRCQLSPRKTSRKLSFLEPLFRFFFGGLFDKIGLSIGEQINNNFDYLFACLPVLKQNGLRDFFIEDDQSAVWLYFGNGPAP